MVEIRPLKTFLDEALEEERGAIEKGFTVLENSYIITNRIVRNMDGKGASVEVLDGKEDRVTGRWRKGDLCYKMAENMFEFCSIVESIIELVSNELGYFAWRFPGSVEGIVRLLEFLIIWAKCKMYFTLKNFH